MLEHGMWTEGLEPESGSLLLESTDLVLQSESDGVVTGTEGVVLLTAALPEARPFEFTWDNPAVGANEYSVRRVPSGLDAWYDGGGGDNASVTVTITDTQQVDLSFRPSIHGWHFSNMTWPRVPNAEIDLGLFKIPIGNASQGMCGGMVYSAIDYYMRHREIPEIRTNPESFMDPYFAFISTRLYDSFHLPTGPLNTYIPYTSADFPPQSRPAVTIKGIPHIRARIAAGTPVALGLIGAVSNDLINALADNHQVLAYSYSRSGAHVRLGIYDPDLDDVDDLYLDLDAESMNVLALDHNTSMANIHMFFDTDYSPSPLPLP